MGKILSRHQRVFQQLLEADRRARQRVEHARENADKILSEADEEAEEIVKKAEREAEEKAEEIVRQARETQRSRETEDSTEAAKTDGEPPDADSLRDQASRHRQSAVDFLVEWVTLAETSDRTTEDGSKEAAAKKDSR